MAEGYDVRLANPAEIQKYSGLKYADDRHDPFWLPEMLRLAILPQCNDIKARRENLPQGIDAIMRHPGNSTSASDSARKP